MTAGIRLARQQQILIERGGVALGDEVARQSCVVAGDDKEVFFIRRQDDIVRAVLAAAVDFFNVSTLSSLSSPLVSITR